MATQAARDEAVRLTLSVLQRLTSEAELRRELLLCGLRNWTSASTVRGWRAGRPPTLPAVVAVAFTVDLRLEWRRTGSTTAQRPSPRAWWPANLPPDLRDSNSGDLVRDLALLGAEVHWERTQVRQLRTLPGQHLETLQRAERGIAKRQATEVAQQGGGGSARARPKSVGLATLAQIGQPWGWELVWNEVRAPWHVRPWDLKGAPAYVKLK